MNAALWTLASVVKVLVPLAVWQVVARSVGGHVAGMDAREIAAYFLATLLIRAATVMYLAPSVASNIEVGMR